MVDSSSPTWTLSHSRAHELARACQIPRINGHRCQGGPPRRDGRPNLLPSSNGIEEGQRPSSSVKRLLHCIGYAALPCPASDDTSNPPSTIATRNSAGTSPSRCP